MGNSPQFLQTTTKASPVLLSDKWNMQKKITDTANILRSPADLLKSSPDILNAADVRKVREFSISPDGDIHEPLGHWAPKWMQKLAKDAAPALSSNT